MRKQVQLVTTLLLVFSGFAYAQEKTVTGKVTDSEGPLPGVSVIVQGTSVGTQTDLDGNYRINVPSGETVLVFQFLGYASQELSVTGKNIINVTLQTDQQQLEQVVVVGYGTQQKEEVTVAVQQVTAEDFNKGVVNDPALQIQGKVAGLIITKPGGDPTDDATIRLRGIASLGAGNEPLIVVDGVPGVDLSSVSPNDIASFNILKDAAAASIYGSRGANGVIEITTKRGKAGQVNVEYNTYVGIEKESNVVEMLSADQWRQYVSENNVEGANDQGFNTDWQQEMLRTAYSHNHYLAVSSGTENMNYRISFDYNKRPGIVKYTDFDKLSGRFTLNQRAIDDRLNVETILSVYRQNNAFPDIENYSIFNFALNYNPTFPVKNPDGTYFQALDFDTQNPIAVMDQIEFTELRQEYMGQLKVEFDVVSGFKVGTRGSLRREEAVSNFYAPKDSRIGEGPNGEGSKDQDDGLDKTLTIYGIYDNTFNDKHKLTLYGGYEYQEFTYHGFSAYGRDFVTDFFGSNGLGANQDPAGREVGSYKNRSKIISFIGRVNYGLNDKYYATLSLRRDGSTKFGANNKWGMFPGVSLSWRITQEPFMKSQTFLDDLKLRVSYGVNGNQAIDPYQSLSTLERGGNFYYNGKFISSYQPARVDNPNLKWERNAELNLGLDFTLFKGRFWGTLDVYNRIRDDLFAFVSVPTPPNVSGTILANVGKTSNKGVELVLNATPVAKQDFNWTTGYIFSINRNKVESLSNEQFSRDRYFTGDVGGRSLSGVTSSIVEVGEEIGAFYGLKYNGLTPEGKYIFEDVNDDGTVNSDDRTYIGHAEPRFIMSLNNTLQYRNFDFTFFLRGVFGHDIINGTALNVADIRRLPNNNVSVAALTNGITDDKIYSSYWIEDGTYIRLDNLQLGYRFSTERINALKGARVFVGAQNLFVITDYTGVDPEVSKGEDDSGQENRNYFPKSRIFTMGLNLTF